jgi:hypothetical protein
MKTTLMLAILMVAVLLTLTAPAHARTWTSADGGKTFNAEYVSSDGRSVVVIMNGSKNSFKINRLSATDQAWVSKQMKIDAAGYRPVSTRSLRDQKIGKQLLHQTFRAAGNRFVSAKINKVPRYYYFYYAASW